MIVISPFSRKLLNGKPNAKNYAHWVELIKMLKADNHRIEQIGITAEDKLVESIRSNWDFGDLADLTNEADLFISVDNFFPHFCRKHCKKVKGVVIFTRSNPKIFGYDENTNILKDEKFLRKDQFGTWEKCDYLEEASEDPKIIYDRIKCML
jgi:hypothetical protein